MVASLVSQCLASALKQPWLLQLGRASEYCSWVSICNPGTDIGRDTQLNCGFGTVNENENPLRRGEGDSQVYGK